MWPCAGARGIRKRMRGLPATIARAGGRAGGRRNFVVFVFSLFFLFIYFLFLVYLILFSFAFGLACRFLWRIGRKHGGRVLYATDWMCTVGSVACR